MADDATRQAARALMAAADHASLAWHDPGDGSPGISRITFRFDPLFGPLTVISALAQHSPALRAAPDCALMLGEDGAKGDPMTWPRLMIRARALFLHPDPQSRAGLRERWLQKQPKALVYIDLADFEFVQLQPLSALWNGGFGRAAPLSPTDLLP